MMIARTGTTLGRVLLVAVLTTATLLAGFFVGKQLVDRHPDAASAGRVTTPYVPGLDQMLRMTKTGECWGNDGKVHPKPSRVWLVARYSGSGDVRYLLRGPAAVERVFASGDWSHVARFCR